jgi:hypothetical protein
MATTDTEIANMALGHLGQGVRIANLTTARTAEANLFRQLYDTIRRATLRDFPWGFAHKIAALGLIETDPNEEWLYSYRQPSDCLRDRKIQSGIRNDNRQSRVSYKTGRDATGALIYTDREDAILEYTIDITEVELYPDDFVLALSLRLAMYAAPQICGEDPFKMGQRAGQMYKFEIDRAMNTSLNEQQEDQEPESELIRARS